MGERIAQAGLIIQTLRDAGYKNTSYAVAELVDNSIEANATDISITIKSDDEVINNRVSERITEIGILDNGDGMDFEILSKCLSFGWGTRLTGATGLGKFGFGLKGASISQAKRIEIYSWQNGESPNFIYLDVDEIIDNDLQDLPEAETKELPREVKALIGRDIGESGTLIVWSKLDRLNPKRAATLINHMNGDMCRIFRHFMDDDDTLGTRRNISVRIVDKNGVVIGDETFLKANDPTYLLKPNNVPGKENEATNELVDQVEINVKGEDGGIHVVKVICSIAKPEIQEMGGNSPVGKHYAKNNGISFVRAGRELELSYKGYYTQSEPRNRWIGLEVQFPPQLDKYFNVPNNKQSVRDFKNFDEDELEGYRVACDQEPDGFEGLKAKMLLDVNNYVITFFRNAEKVVKARGVNKRKQITGEQETTGTKATKKIQELNNNEPTLSAKKSAEKTEDQRLSELKAFLMATDPSLSETDAESLARYQENNLVEIAEKDWAGNTFLDIEFMGKGAHAIVNRRHKFYTLFFDHLQHQEDKKGIEALKLMILAMTRSEDEMRVSGEITDEQFEKLRDRWGKYLNELLPLVQ